MPLDGIYIYSLGEELRKKLIGARVDKISQPEKDEIILSLRGDRINYRLLMSANSVYPKIHLTNYNKPNPAKAPMFCMVLRKYLSTAKVLDIRQVSTDRIIIMDFESTDELGFDSVYSLVIEIMGRHSNITLIRKRDNSVVDSIKHITLDMSSFRQLYPGVVYLFPPASNKLNPFDFELNQFVSFIEAESVKYDINMFSKIFTGISAQFSKSICSELKENNISLTAENTEEIYSYVKNILTKLKNYDFQFLSYSEGNAVKEFYCTPLHNFQSYEVKNYASPSALIEDFYYEKDKFERLNSKSADLQKIINNNLDRCLKKLEIFESTYKDSDAKEKFRIYGVLLTSYIYSIQKGDKHANVLNYYSEEEEYLDIPLDENKTPSENIQTYYKKYNKMKKTAEMAKIQIETTEDEVKYLQSVLLNIKNAESYEDIEECKKELMESGYIRFRKSDKKKEKPAKPLHFISSDGHHIYVGKNNIQNDYLTLKFADKQDVWLHTKNIPGSHVLIKSGGKVSNQTLEEAAVLAAFYSKAKESTKVPVDYTEVKNVKKPSGAKPGMVIYYTNKTIYVNPEKLELQKIE
jgi:predicted ribosome quality control (RQC) complex YloA/Tae2 family protein